MQRSSVRCFPASLVLVLCSFLAWPAGLLGADLGKRPKTATPRDFCDTNSGLCAELWRNKNYEGKYIGHDEPAVLFYSSTPGSGNNSIYYLTLPKDPPTQPNQSGTGGNWNFQLHPAFWFSMAMCDTQSAPEFTTTCVPDTDANIFDNPNPAASDYMGHHPGAALMELQFYPPGWNPNISCDATRWCAALTIDSFNFDMNNGTDNNRDCLNKVGEEPINFAYITFSGVANGPANPLTATNATFTFDPTKDLAMNSGDTLLVTLQDTSAGFQVTIKDLTSGKSGSMTASTGNGFGQIVFNPNASKCSVKAYAFHPMYSTSSEHTRVPWAAHSLNIAFADEIGHFEFCGAIDAEGGNCTAPAVSDASLDGDDTVCYDGLDSTLVKVTGCTSTEFDFDGVSYKHSWPGSGTSTQNANNPTPIRFTGPKFRSSTGGLLNYSRMAFEADLPSIEGQVATPCNQSTGAHCVNPPPGAAFYPFFSTAQPALSGSSGGQCFWQLGGGGIPGTTNSFGGNSTVEFGSLLTLFFPDVGGSSSTIGDFRRILSYNPCPANGTQDTLTPAVVSFGDQLKGTTSSGHTVTLFNHSSTAALSISSIALTGTNAADFKILFNNTTCGSPGTLAALSSCTVTTAFAPTATGTRVAYLSISDSDPNTPQLAFLNGTGTLVAFSPLSWNYGSVAVGTTSAAKVFTLTNHGTTSVTLSSISISGTNKSDFLIQPQTTCSTSTPLVAGGSCTVTVAFKPAAQGSRSAKLSVSDSAVGSPHTASLSGTGS